MTTVTRLPDDEMAIADLLLDPVRWGEAYLRNRDGGVRK